MDWYRWWHGSANDPKLRMIASDCGMSLACVVGVWAYILECASSNHIRGQIDNFDYEVVSFHLGIDVVTPCNAMKRRKMLHETDETLVVCNWDKWQPKRERDDVSTDRVKKFRDKQKQRLTECNATETPCNATETNVTPRVDKIREDKSITQDKPARKKSDAHPLPEDFIPNETCKTLASELGVSWEGELPKFRDHHLQKGTLGKDWNAGFRTWLNNGVKFGTAVKAPSTKPFDNKAWLKELLS